MANPAAKPPLPQTSADAAAAPSAVTATKLNPLFVVLPLVVLVLVAAGVGWELLRDRMEAQQSRAGADAWLGVAKTAAGVQREKSREVTQPEALAPEVPAAEADELSGLGKKRAPAPTRPTGPVAPAERAWRAVKGAYSKLEARNETTARKYRMRILTLEDRKTSAAESTFVQEAAVLEEALRGELAKPENQ